MVLRAAAIMAGSMKSADVPRGIAVSVVLEKPGSTKKCRRPIRNHCFGEVEARKSVDVPSGIAVLVSRKHVKVRTSQAKSLFSWSCKALRVQDLGIEII